MKTVPTNGEKKCSNCHMVPAPETEIPDHCPVCGARMRLVHPFLCGLGIGFVVCIGVSILELMLFPLTNYTNGGLSVLLGAIPLVFLLSGSLGMLLMKRYRNTAGLGSYIGGTSVMVFIFTVLWIAFILMAAMLM